MRTLDSPGRARQSEVVFGKEGVKRRKKEVGRGLTEWVS